jgi:hypothetical protein
MDHLRPILASYGLLFHVTSDERWAQIQNEGFDPAIALELNGHLYDGTPFAGKGFVCFSIPRHLNHVCRMFDDGMGAIADKILLQIPAGVIAQRQFDLDRTKQEILLEIGEEAEPDADTFRSILETHGYVACFDAIPAHAVQYVCRVEEFLHQPGDNAGPEII